MGMAFLYRAGAKAMAEALEAATTAELNSAEGVEPDPNPKSHFSYLCNQQI
jgi:hypothetical protein